MNKVEQSEKGTIQEADYFFPYHWIQYDCDESNKIYDLYRGRFLYTSYVNEVVKSCMKIAPKSVLDIGCGDGKVLDVIYNAYNKDIKNKPYLCGCDISIKALQFAKAFNTEIDWIQGEFKNIDQKFDLIICMEVLEHIPDGEIENFINDINQKLNEEGHLIITVPTICAPVAPKHYRHYDLELIKKQFKECNDLNITDVTYIGKNTRIYRKYRELFCTSRFFLRSRFLEKLFWNYYRKFCLYGNNSKQYLDMVIEFKKVAKGK